MANQKRGGAMTAKEVAMALADRAEQVAMMLLPQGKRSGREWRAGSTNGDAGSSLGVCVSGGKAGVWKDFSDSGKGGDLLDLWMQVHGLSASDALREAKQYLGVVDTPKFAGANKVYKKPTTPKGLRGAAGSDKSAVQRYLTEDRMLTTDTLAVYKIGEVADYNSNGPTIVFGSIKGGELRRLKYLPLKRGEDGKKLITQSADSEPTCFGWHVIPDTAREVVVCEGEIDAMTLYQYGRPAVSTPMGGGGGSKQSWVDADWDVLSTFDTVYLCMDNDAVGREATEELLRRIGEDRCKIVTLPCKDANECLQKGVSKADIDACFSNAKSILPDGLKTPIEFLNRVVDRFYPPSGVPAGLTSPWRDFPLRFRRGETTVWTGWSGHRKSMVLGQLMIHAAYHGEGSVIFSLEMTPDATLERMVRQASAMYKPPVPVIEDCLDWLSDKIWIYDKHGRVSVDEVDKVIRFAYRRHGIRHVVVDSFMRVGNTEDDNKKQAEVIQALTEIALSYRIHMHLVAHARKPPSDTKGVCESTPPSKHDMRGSQQHGDNAFNIVAVHRNVVKDQCIQAHKKGQPIPVKGMTIEDAWQQHDMGIYCYKSREQHDAETTAFLDFDLSSLQVVDRGETNGFRYFGEDNPPL